MSTVLACIGMTEGDVRTARAVIAAYNRSNGLNLMAHAAFITPTTTEPGSGGGFRGVAGTVATTAAVATA